MTLGCRIVYPAPSSLPSLTSSRRSFGVPRPFYGGSLPARSHFTRYEGQIFRYYDFRPESRRMRSVRASIAETGASPQVLVPIADELRAWFGQSPPAEGQQPQDAAFMQRALQLSRQALGHTAPNPMVGCVIVDRFGRVVGEGYHPQAGQPHAEVWALRQAGELARGATAYVTLEPCSHFGRTPPCADAVLRAGIARCVVGCRDPNPQVAGRGIERLRKGGVAVVAGVEEAACRRNIDAFAHGITRKEPFSALRLLAEYDAVVVTDTALLAGNPTLLSSEPRAKQPLRVVLARSLARLPPAAAVLADTAAAPTLVVTDERAIAEEVEAAAQGTGLDAETWLRELGCDLVVLENDFDPSDVVSVLKQRNVHSILWDSTLAPVAGRATGDDWGPGDLPSWLVEQEAVNKAVVTVTGQAGGDIGVLGGTFAAEDMMCYKKNGEIVVEALLRQ